MAEKLTCEVLVSIKGLDPKKPGEYTHPGTAAEPVVVDLPDSDATKALINSGALRIYPGPKAKAAAPLKPADLKSLQKAEEVLTALIARYQKEAESADDSVKAALQADIADAEADLAKVRELLK